FFHISGQIGAVRDLIEILQGLLAIAPLLKASQELGKRLSCRALATSGQSGDKAANQTNENQPSPHVLWLLAPDSWLLCITALSLVPSQDRRAGRAVSSGNKPRASARRGSSP